MAESRKRKTHQQKRTAEIPASQRAKGRVVWAVLIAVFAVIIAYFSAGDDWTVLAIAAIIGAVLGYFIGKSMEQEAAHK
jgi:membrane protein YqaA with SNARE-associated domain